MRKKNFNFDDCQEVRAGRRWRRDEDLKLIRQVQARPQNLRYCFMIVADELGRTEGAVAGRWYSKVSKDETNLCFFTASSKHVAKNRKNGEGVTSNANIWVKLVNIIRNLGN